MKINREELLGILSAVQPGLAAKEIIEQSQSFLFKGGMVTTYNDEISVRHPIAFDLEGVVKADELHKLLSKVKAKELEIEATENEFRIKSSRTKAGIRLETEFSLPIDEIADPKSWKPVPEGFLEGIKITRFSASSDMTRLVLTCIRIEGSVMETCDRYRLTRFKLKGKGAQTFKKPVLVPASSLAHLLKYEPKEVGKTKGWIHFRMENGAVFSCRTVEGDYPNTEKLLKVQGAAVEFPTRIGGMIERAQIFAHGDLVQDKFIEVSIADDRLMIKGEGDAGWVKERARIDYSGPKVSFMVNPQFLMDVLDILSSVTIGKSRLKMEGEGFVHVVHLFAGGE